MSDAIPLITVCCRDGSKGLPDKHILPFCGQSLIAWTIQQAQAWGKGELRIITDIPAVIYQYQAIRLPFPRTELKLVDLRYGLEYAEEETGEQYNPIIDLDVTNPLRLVSHIDEAYALWTAQKPPTIVSVTPPHRNPYFNQIELNAGRLSTSNWIRGKEFYRRQDVPQVWDMNCNIYVYSRDYLIDERNNRSWVFTTMPYMMPEWTFRDIDTQFHFDLAEWLFKKYVMGN